MASFVAVACPFPLDPLHGVLPDEHAWPITFGHALGGARGEERMQVGLVFTTSLSA